MEQKAIKKDKLKRKGERKRKKTKRKKNHERNLFMNVKTLFIKVKPRKRGKDLCLWRIVKDESYWNQWEELWAIREKIHHKRVLGDRRYGFGCKEAMSLLRYGTGSHTARVGRKTIATNFKICWGFLKNVINNHSITYT